MCCVLRFPLILLVCFCIDVLLLIDDEVTFYYCWPLLTSCSIDERAVDRSSRRVIVRENIR